MLASRGMGAIRTDKVPKAKKKYRKEPPQDLDMYSKGGMSKSRVNEAANYTKPGMRKELFNRIKSQAVQGTKAGEWSARKSQLLAKQYKSKGGRYRD